jgi:lipopolysaccharide transport system ATP-binding protein
MSDIAIRCEHLSKQYRIGERESYKALRDVITDGVASPFRRLRSALRNGSHNSNGADSALITHHSSLSADSRQPTPGTPYPDNTEFWALDDVSFDVKRGEVVGIIGRNGAGKSTLLKILSRITKPTRGQAYIHGRVGSLLEVGTGFHPELTGRENIYLNAAILGMRKVEVERKFDEIVAFAEVEKFIDTPVKRYSSGMYVRLAFAVAAHLEPEILVIDEVLAVGDAAFQKKCLGKIGEVAQGGRTVLFVSHNMGAVRGLCTEAIWIDQGKLVSRSTSSEVIDQYLKGTMQQLGSSVDLSSISRQGDFGNRLKLRSIQFNCGRPILHGEPLTVRIEFDVHSDIQNAAFGFGFSSLDGTRIMTVDTDLQEVQRNLSKHFVGTVIATIDQLHLQPGNYTVDVGGRSGNNSMLDYVCSCAQIEVLPGPRTPSLIIREPGGLRIPAGWEWA